MRARNWYHWMFPISHATPANAPLLFTPNLTAFAHSIGSGVANEGKNKSTERCTVGIYFGRVLHVTRGDLTRCLTFLPLLSIGPGSVKYMPLVDLSYPSSLLASVHI